MLRSLSTVALAALLLVGCKSTPTVIHDSAMMAIAVALVQTEASTADATTVRDIAADVQLAVAGDGSYETVLIRALISEAIEDNFSGQEEIIYMLVVNNLIEQIVSALVESNDIPEDERVFINAAASGVEDGATIFINASQP